MKFLAQFENFHEMASKAAGGLTDFGPDDYQEPLKLLLSDYDSYPVYNQPGAESLVQQVIGLLVGRLSLYQGLKANPDALKVKVDKPIFIVGMARTGTTVLHRILTHDTSIQSLPFWLENVPQPRPPRESWESNPAFQQVKHALDTSVLFNEEMKALHPVAPEIADECRWVLDQTFWASSIILGTETPNYRRWFLNADSRYAYEYHKKALGLIGLGDSRRWVLKDPGHMSGIDSLLSMYPDACIVQTHRDPLECMKSISNLSLAVRRMREDNITAEEIGAMQLEFWSHALRKMESYRKSHDANRFIDFHISETRQDPVGVIERIFDYFDLPVTPEARQSWNDQIIKDPHMGYKGKGAQQDFGLTKQRVNEAIGGYYQRYLEVCEMAGVKA